MPIATVMLDEHGPYIEVRNAIVYRLHPQVYRPQPAQRLREFDQPLKDLRHPLTAPEATRFAPGTPVRLRLHGLNNRMAEIAPADGFWRDAPKEDWFGHSATSPWGGRIGSVRSEDHWRPLADATTP